jgi:hypothetical protein
MTDTPLAPPPVAFSDLNSPAAPPPAAPPAPSWRPEGFPVTPPAFDAAEAVAARAEIQTKIGDKEFYKALIAEKERGLSGPASQAWAALHKAGYPSPNAITSPEDAAKQADARNSEQWNSYIGALKQQFPLAANQIAEIKEGIVNSELRQAAVEMKDRLVRDKAFYRRLVDGDVDARTEWARLGIILSMKPVAGYMSPHVIK